MWNPFAKKVDEETKVRLAKTKTANELVGVRDFVKDVVYTADNHVFAYLRIQPISLELLSPSEQELKIRQLSSEFSAQTKMYKIISIPRPVDVSYMLNKLNTLRQESEDMVQKALLSDEIKELSEFSSSGQISERHFYMIIWEENRKDGVVELMKRANDIVYRFKACKIEVRFCKQTDIVKFFNLFANPNYAHLEGGDIEEYIPFVPKNER